MKLTSNPKVNRAVVLILFGFFYANMLVAQSGIPPIEKEKFQHNKEVEDALGYTQAVKVGNTIYISGIPSGGDVPTQIKNVYQGLQKVLENYGAGFEHVVKENLFTTDMEGIKQHLELRKSFYKGEYPAATWVEVKGLYDPSLKLEVELIAVVP